MQIVLEQLVKRYNAHIALADVSLDIPAGAMVAVVGPSGCGKSTLLRLLAGFITPEDGTICFDQQYVQHLPPEQRPTSLVFQNYALWPHKTVFDNIAFGLQVRRWSRAKIVQRVREMLMLVGLSDVEQRYPSQLSGGQQQRIALARSLAVAPAILLLDEPLSNLDAQIRVQMRDELRNLQQRLGVTTIYVTHDQEEALSVADRVVVMNVGRVEQYASPLEVYQRPATAFVARFIGQSNIMRGQIATVNGDTISVQLCADPSLKGSPQSPIVTVLRQGQLLPSTMRPGQFVLLTAKPEQMLWKPQASNEEGWVDGRIQQLSFLGAHWRIQVSTCWGPLVLLSSTTHALTLKQSVSVSFPPTQARLFLENDCI